MNDQSSTIVSTNVEGTPNQIANQPQPKPSRTPKRKIVISKLLSYTWKAKSDQLIPMRVDPQPVMYLLIADNKYREEESEEEG